MDAASKKDSVSPKTSSFSKDAKKRSLRRPAESSVRQVAKNETTPTA